MEICPLPLTPRTPSGVARMALTSSASHIGAVGSPAARTLSTSSMSEGSSCHSH
jgi:hypothetical protein